MKIGMEIGLAKINAEGGILGKQVEAKYFDCIDSLQTTVNAVKLAVEDDELSCLFLIAKSTFQVAASPDILKAKIPTFVNGSGEVVMNEHNPYIWQIRTIDNYVGVGMANFAMKKLGAKNPAVWSTSLDSAVATKNVIIKTFKENGIVIPESMIFTSADEEKNYAPLAAQIKASGADCLLIFSSTVPISLLAKALGDIGLNIPVVGSAGTAGSAVVEAAKDAVEGWYCVADYIPSENRAIVQEMVSAYKAKYEGVPDTNVSFTFDMCLAFRAACENAKSTERVKVNEGIKQIKDLEITMGKCNAFDDNSMLSTLFIGQMKDGAPEYVTTVQYR